LHSCRYFAKNRCCPGDGKFALTSEPTGAENLSYSFVVVVVDDDDGSDFQQFAIIRC
jgi:hypothetical protein